MAGIISLRAENGLATHRAPRRPIPPALQSHPFQPLSTKSPTENQSTLSKNATPPSTIEQRPHPTTNSLSRENHQNSGCPILDAALPRQGWDTTNPGLFLPLPFRPSFPKGICFCSCLCLSVCHSRRESAFAVAFAFPSVFPEGNLLLQSPLPFCLSFPKGICFSIGMPLPTSVCCIVGSP